MADNVFDQFHEQDSGKEPAANVFDQFHEPANKPGLSSVQSTPAASPAPGPSGDFTPIGDASPDFGSGTVTPGEMDAAGTEFRRLGSITAQAAGARTLNLGATLQQGLNPGEAIAARLTGVPDEYTQAGQMRQMAKSIAPNVAPDDRGGRLAEMVGGLAPDLVAATATGGLAELPAGASLSARALQGAATMALPAAENSRKAYDRAIASGLTPAQAAEQAAVAGGGTLAMGAVPANIPGDLATRALSGAAIAALQTEGQRRVANALLPVDRPDLQQPFDAFDLGAGALTGGVLAGVLGHGGQHEDAPPAEAGISKPTPRVPSTDFVADANGNLQAVPRPREQPTTEIPVVPPIDPNAGPISRAALEVISPRQPVQNDLPAPVRFPDAEPGTLADAANVVDKHSYAATARVEAPTSSVFDQFHQPVAADRPSDGNSGDTPESSALRAIAAGEHPADVLADAGPDTVRAVAEAMGKRYSPNAPHTAIIDRLGELPQADRMQRADTGANNLDASRDTSDLLASQAQSSPAFRDFFDGSHVTNDDGSPRVVFHGTGDDFNVFRDDRLGENTGHMTAPLGHFLTESEAEAQRYAEKASDGVPADERVISAYASIKNPAVMTKDQLLAIDSHGEAWALRQWLQGQGYDGIRLDLDNGKRQWVAFDSGQIKSASDNRGTFDRNNPDIRFQRTPDESGTGLPKQEVNRLAAGVLKTDADRAGVQVVDTATSLPKAIQDHMQANSIPPEEVKAAHQGGKTYLVADRLSGAKDVEEAIYHEHFVHGGLRARYGTRLGGKLDQLLTGIGGVDGLRNMAKDQGIDLSHYEATTLGNASIPERHQGLILMEELLAHVAHTTGTLKRTIQEWVGTLRNWLRSNGFAKLGDYGVTDLAHVLKKAREAAVNKSQTEDSSQPFYQRDPENTGRKSETSEPAGIPGESVRSDRSSTQPAAGSSSSVANARRAEPPPSNLPPRSPKESNDQYLRRIGRAAGDDIRAATSLREQQKTIGRHALREMYAKRARAMDTADAVFGEFRKHFDRTDPRANFDAIDDWETGRQVRDPTFREFLSKMNSGFAERIDRLHELDPNALRNLITHYFPHIYTDPVRAGSVLNSLLQRRSLAGDKSFLKQREWPTLGEAMHAGLEPVSSNPVDLALLKYAAMDKYIGMLELKKELDDRGWLVKLGSNDSPPFGFKRVADPAFNGSAIPETLARDVTNYLDPGFSKFAAWRTLRGIQNFMVAADLGFSGFHATFTSTDNVIMHLDVAARRAAIGDSRGAATTLVKALTSVATSPFEGHKLNQQWRGLRESDANTAAILDALERGGARWKMSTTEYQNAIPKMARLFRQMMGTGIGPQIKGKTPAQIVVGAARLPVTALQAAAETGSYLIHHVLVPNQKMAARALLFKYELDRRAQDLEKQRGDYAGILDAMHPDVVRQLAAQVNDVVDYRLGQMAYDNRFWNRTVQDVAQAAVMAPGWQYGMLQTVLGAGKAVKDLVKPQRFVAPLDKAEAITDAHMGRVGSNLSYFLTLALALGGGMAALQYLLTGKGPESIKDYFFPKTGRKNDDDSDERLQLPNYWVDHYKLTTEPARTAENKIHPLWKMLWEIGHNKDYFGTQIRNPNAPAWDQALEVGAYMAHKFVPITVGNMQKGVQHNESTAQQVGHFFGINSAPAGVARSEFQNFVMQGGSKGWGEHTRTSEEAQRRQTARSASAAMRRGDEPDFGGLAPKDIANARKDSKQQVPALLFKRLSDPDKLRAYDLATPDERARYGLDAAMRRLNLDRSTPFKSLPAAEQAQLRQRLQAIRRGDGQAGNVFDQFKNP